MGTNKSMSDELKALAELSLGDEAKDSLSDAADVTESAERMLGLSDAVEQNDGGNKGSAEPVTDQWRTRS
jgi:hypothetical protein